MPDSEQSTSRDWRQITVWVVFAALCVSLGWSTMILAFGTVHPFRAVSGHSMLPTLRTGDLVIIRGVPEWSLRVGEIVAIHVPKVDQITYHYPPAVVHRIVALYIKGTTLTVQTKGDNQGPDPFTIPASDVRGRMLFAIPYIGYGFLFLHSPQGHIAVIGLAVLVLLYVAVTVLVGREDDGLIPEQPIAPLSLGSEGQALAMAIHEYGEHLRSHTAVVRELGGTTAELRHAAEAQNEILAGLRNAMTSTGALSNRGAWTEVPPASAVSSTGYRYAPGAGDLPRSVDATTELVVHSRKAGRRPGRHRRGAHRLGYAAEPCQPCSDGTALYPSRRARKMHQRA